MPVIQLSADLSDAHQPLLKDDYDLLEFILAKTHPQVVTLEYIQEADALREQLGRLSYSHGTWATQNGENVIARAKPEAICARDCFASLAMTIHQKRSISVMHSATSPPSPVTKKE